MVRVIGPMFGLDARGKLGSALVYSIRKGVNYTRQYLTPKDKQSVSQLQNRGAFQDGVSKWRWGIISTYAKSRWDSYSTGTTESGYNRFMRFYLKDNYDSATKQKVSPQVIPEPQ